MKNKLNGKPLEYKPGTQGEFRFRKLGDIYLVTGGTGCYAYLSEQEFLDFISGNLDPDSEKTRELKIKGLIMTGDTPSLMLRSFIHKNAFMTRGTSLHIVIPTLRCNLKCSYCQASAGAEDGAGLDMDLSTAKQIVDTIFKSTAPTIVIEFQGGEPLLNFDVVDFIIDYALEKNAGNKKQLLMSIVSNMTYMDDEKIDYFISRGVGLCTSMDGPEVVHRKNRGGDYQLLISNFKNAHQKYTAQMDYVKPSALTTITKNSLPYAREIIDTYIELGLEGIHLRPMHPFGVGGKTFGSIGVSAEEFLDFYRESMDYIIEINRGGVDFVERASRIRLIQMLTDDDPNFLDLRSPCGAGIGQLAYNYNGDVYTCDEGRMLGAIGDPMFKLGNVWEDTAIELLNNDTVKACMVSSCLDGIPGCMDCAFKHYCGVCPVYNYTVDGSIFSKAVNNELCRINKGIFDYLFSMLRRKEEEEIFTRWVFSKRMPV